MKQFLLSTCVLASSFLAADAFAQTAVQRTFVSTTGADTNTASSCSATSPCRSFTAALTVTKSGGEIVPLTSGGYGAVTINQSVQIATPPGVYAAITATSGNGITVTAGASDTVILKGLVINGLGTGANGINATTFSTLTIENCSVSNFSNVGIFVDASASGDYVYIKDTTVRNGGDAGIYLRANYPTYPAPSNYAVNASLIRVVSEGNATNGIVSARGAKATVSDSEASGNGATGFLAYADLGQPAEMNCDRCVASNNVFSGFTVHGYTGVMRAARSTATDNGTGFNQSYSGTFESLTGTNLVRGNTTDTSGTITPVTSP